MLLLLIMAWVLLLFDIVIINIFKCCSSFNFDNFSVSSSAHTAQRGCWHLLNKNLWNIFFPRWNEQFLLASWQCLIWVYLSKFTRCTSCLSYLSAFVVKKINETNVSAVSTSVWHLDIVFTSADAIIGKSTWVGVSYHSDAHFIKFVFEKT